MWPAAMIVWGPGFTAARHRHHCVQLVMTFHGTLRIRSGSGDKWEKCDAALVRQDAMHEIEASHGSTLLIGFVDAESELGAALSETIHGDIFCVPVKQVTQWRLALGPNPNTRRVEQWMRKDLLNERRPVRIHPRVKRILKYLRARLGRGSDLSLKTLAAVSGLSPSRLMHVFTESVGVPLRQYILWLRLQRGACELINGATAVEASHVAGFSDAAHLTRTFRRMLGTTPSDLALRKRMSQGVSAEVVVNPKADNF